MMNKRIKELAKQSGISILYEYDGYDGHAAVANLADIEKFAELIVRECVEVANTYQNRGGNCYVDDMIAKHFGVEE